MKFATLGPEGTNHDINTRRYIEFHGLENSSIIYLESFFDGLDMMRRGDVDFMVQVAAHHHVADVVEKFYEEIFVVDCFVGRTKRMGLVTRTDVDNPQSVGYVLPTAGYFTPKDWPVQVHTLSNADTRKRLLSGELDSGFTALEIVDEFPGRFKILKEIGEVDNAWLVYGRNRTNTGQIIAWRDAPIRAFLTPTQAK